MRASPTTEIMLLLQVEMGLYVSVREGKGNESAPRADRWCALLTTSNMEDVLAQ